MAARGYLGAGDLYIDRFSGSTLTGRTGPFECRRFEITPNVELREMVSKGKNTYGQVVETVAIPSPFDLTVEMSEVNRESMALALLGTASAITQTAAAAQTVTIALEHDVWVPVGSGRISNVVITGEVLGTDYIVNAELGLIKALSTGGIVDGASTAVTFDRAAITGSRIAGGTSPQLRVRFYLDGKNFVDDAPTLVTVYEAVIAADSAFDFLADEFNVVSLPGRMKTPTGFNEPFTVELRDAV